MNNFTSIIKNSEQNHLSCLKTETEDTHIKNVYLSKDKSLEIKIVSLTLGNTTESVTEIKNISSNEIDINQLSSAYVEIKNEGKQKWFSPEKYTVHFCQNCWLGEGQWKSATLDDLGLYQVHDMHQHNCYVSVSSRGSQSTSRFYPLVMIEDKELCKTHFFEIKSSSSWYIEICIDYNEKNEESLYVFLSGTCEKNDGWHKKLAPNESYRSHTSVFGTVNGGFEDAVRELNDYKRKMSLTSFENNIPPVCFNDYMNCCWAMPDYKKTKALIDAASEAGAEIFCMDSGWQASLIDDKFRCIGDWAISKSRFSPYSFADVIKYANSKGLKFGAWLEIEGVQKGTEGYEKLDKYILKRRGNNIGTPKSFYDFREPYILDKIEKVFDDLYSLGIRYIKNDYNQTVGIGCDGKDSLSEELRKNAEAFLKFIDRIRLKYKDLIIENCGSGAMRCDFETLSHFHLQSTSDQEVYTVNPSIICGTLAYLPPEKAGIWSYPYPVRYNDRFENKISESDYSDGKQTVFNMVNSMMGLMYLSGRIDACDDFNKKLVKDAVDVYKKIRINYAASYPIYPGGTFRMNQNGVFSLGLYNYNKKVAYLAVWKINSECQSPKVELSKYGNIKKVTKLYPLLNDYDFRTDKNTIMPVFPYGNAAMLLEVNFF